MIENLMKWMADPNNKGKKYICHTYKQSYLIENKGEGNNIVSKFIQNEKGYQGIEIKQVSYDEILLKDKKFGE